MTNDFDLVIRGGAVADGGGGALHEADVAVKDGLIAAVGKVSGSGREELDARGHLVTPGFVDVHTHYDGQLTWSERLSPSSSHGVTTVVVGNCGVGFAPCKEEHRESLVRMMEGVEDIPEAVMAEGLPWNWESFADYLDSIERRPHDIDFAVLLPHSPLRVFVMGERALNLEPATEADRAQMRALTKAAMEAGAVGFATSHNIYHKASDGTFIPSKGAEEAELREIAMGLADAGRGAIQGITLTDNQRISDFEVFHRVALQTGRPLSYTLAQMPEAPDLWREVVELIARDNAAGGRIRAQVFNRPVGVIVSLEASVHPFRAHPYFAQHLAKLPLADLVREMRRPEVRAELLRPVPSEESLGLRRGFANMYPLSDPPDYEPDPSTSVAAMAAARGVDPLALAYDALMEHDGHGVLLITAANYTYGNLDTTLELLKREDTVLGLGDGGAHYGVICDASYPTTHLAHWTRDRRRGERIDLAQAVRMLTDQPARLYGFHDRGRIAVGKRADLNVIDLDRLRLGLPHVTRDLPAGGKRLTQGAHGYVATFVAGQAIQREGEDTGARPGRLVRDAGV